MITKAIHPDLLSEIPIIKKAMMEIKEKDEIIQRQAAEIEKLKKNKKMD